ncbi:MAG: DUF4279 domain-containing protein [Pseudomonadota bacterium]
MKLDFQLLGTSVVPKEISRLTGITPDTELARGERNAALDLPRQNIWSVESHVESEEVSEHWANIERLQESKEAIREIAKTGTARLTLVIARSHRLPSLQIPPAMSAFAGFVNAVIDIDQLQ